jgi:hypothetical protein
MNCIVNFPVTQKNMRAEEKSRKKAKKERRRKADVLPCWWRWQSPRWR